MQDTLELKDKTSSPRLKVAAAVTEFIKDYYAFKPNPEDPDPTPWPWRHIINKVKERVGGRFNSWASVALNPQPLPPKAAFAIALAEEVIERGAMMQQLADGFMETGERRGIIVVGGYFQRFVDDLCPERPKIKPPKFWGPWPPEPDPDPRWQGLDLAIIATIFQNEARVTGHEGFRNVLAEAGEKIMQVGVSRL
jgi:hypothetical protein